MNSSVQSLSDSHQGLLRLILIPFLLLACAGCGGQEQRFDLPEISLSLTAFPVQVDLDGSTTSRLRAILVRSSGERVRGARIEFTTNEGALGEERMPTLHRITARDGIVELALRGAGKAGVATVRASSGEAMAFVEVVIH